MKKALFLAIVVAAGFAAWAVAAPKPALVHGPELELELHSEPQLVSITLPGDTEPRRFWYLLYTVTNNTGQDVQFYPQFDLLTDTFKLYHAGLKVRRPVFEAIRARYSTSIPLMEAESMITGRILVGQDNARDSVAVFEDFDPQATSVSIFVAGLSSETVTVEHPMRIDPETGKNAQVLLRKTLVLEYQVPGDQYNPDNRVMLYRDRNWVMR